MNDQAKLLKVFDEIGITYVTEDCGDGYISVYIAGKNDSLAEAKRYDHLIEFCNGELASY